jgi:tRNA threonylcarbamoyladenosine biosynthesis protein TsaE
MDVALLQQPEDWTQWALDRSQALAGVVTLSGPMGSGKTTAVALWLKALGSNDAARSPSFGLVNEYESPLGPIYHFDLYRLDRPEQVAAIGFDEYLYSGQPCWIEWPERAGALIPHEASEVRIEVLEDGSRRVTFVGTYRK